MTTTHREFPYAQKPSGPLTVEFLRHQTGIYESRLAMEPVYDESNKIVGMRPFTKEITDAAGKVIGIKPSGARSTVFRLLGYGKTKAASERLA